jgi:acyl-coenzyme A synthetase/AMP-(fatty) acid ligase
MGKPAPGYDLKIIDKEGNEKPVGKEGEIAIKVMPDSPVGLFSGYLNDQDRTESCFIGEYYLTGDRGYCDEDGYIWFISRSDDVIVTSGYRVGPFEVESALISHGAVLESAVVASPDKERGSVRTCC